LRSLILSSRPTSPQISGAKGLCFALFWPEPQQALFFLHPQNPIGLIIEDYFARRDNLHRQSLS